MDEDTRDQDLVVSKAWTKLKRPDQLTTNDHLLRRLDAPYPPPLACQLTALSHDSPVLCLRHASSRISVDVQRGEGEWRRWRRMPIETRHIGRSLDGQVNGSVFVTSFLYKYFRVADNHALFCVRMNRGLVDSSHQRPQLTTATHRLPETYNAGSKTRGNVRTAPGRGFCFESTHRAAQQSSCKRTTRSQPRQGH